MEAKTNKKLCFITLLLCIGTCLVGQVSDSSEVSRLYRPEWSIKLNPLAILAYTPGIELGVERSINKQATLHLGGSYLNDFNIYGDQDFQGYKAILEYRHFNLLSKHKRNNAYTAFQFHLKQAFAEGSTLVDRAAGNYQQVYPVKATNTSLDFLIATGWVVPIDELVTLDFSLLYGAKRLSLSLNDLPEDASFRVLNNFLGFTLNEEGSKWFPVFRLQIKLNFCLVP